MMAAQLGRSRKEKILRNWDNKKLNVMYDAKIIEHTENDDYWGDGGDGKGKNMLDKILMKVREELKENQK